MKSPSKENAKIEAKLGIQLPDNLQEVASDTDLKLLFDFVPMETMIHPIRARNNQYRKYIMRLGKLSKNSLRVQRQMRPIAIELYKAGDPSYVSMGNNIAKIFLLDTEITLKSLLGDKENWPQIQKYDIEQMAAFAGKCQEVFKEEGFSFRLDILWFSFKLLQIPIAEDIKQGVNREMTTRWQALKQDENKKEADSTPTDLPVEKPDPSLEEKVLQEDKTEIAEGNAAEESGPASDEITKPAAAEPLPEETWYVGKINIIDNFYNFVPLGTWDGKEYVALSEEDLSSLLPNSQQYQNINLSYTYPDQKFMEEHFHENDLVFLRFTQDDLLENKDGRGNLRATGCRMACVDAIKNGKLRFGDELGLYTLLPKSCLQDPLTQNSIVRIRDSHIYKGEKVLLRLASGQVAGPYIIFHSNRYGYYLQPNVPDTQYLLEVYEASALQAVTIMPADGTLASRQEKNSWDIYQLLPKSQTHTVDLMPVDALLLSLGKLGEPDGLTSQQIREFLNRQKDALFANVPQTIGEKRIARIEDLLQQAENTQQVNDKVGAFLYTYLVRQKNQDWVKRFIADFSKAYPEVKKVQAPAPKLGTDKQKNLEAMAKWVAKMPGSSMTTTQLLDYLVSCVQKERPLYGRNVILNLFICLTQGFLTVFSGAPGSGKTSICNIMAKVLGLTQFDKRLGTQNVVGTLNRYIPVSVERGWTSKRDFIGYYNPLTKAFEESNRDIFESLRLLDAEQQIDLHQYPFVFLLDEANLSPMEYYWADFMNVCDDPKESHTLNLGNGYSIHVPETLRFVATINNDHTTETLSPRLIDRAWIISLPENEYVPRMGRGLTEQDCMPISWAQLQNVFGVAPRENSNFSRVEQGIYDSLKERLQEQNIRLSTRIDTAIHEYWRAASRVMEKENDSKPGIIALDYAVAQKILPKLSGNGAEYEMFLQTLRDECFRNHLRQSAALLDRMIAYGNRRMKFYQFFQ